ncbi:uncharacterized protein B0H18DRAFT_1043439 [Fomitopsis serialis]|uniref:uncharacterized protein n=1 Tax=Fomitopsis serialis TaxID=139415 RepID=UPI00200849CD|nr:uncharacterized protein B0H18DRAFT_1043439 [Neoantrodia serialis]KAH9914955.1 hypothetical protein B0H18DRAFT_1043439 [Neoantrodia serialis]
MHDISDLTTVVDECGHSVFKGNVATACMMVALICTALTMLALSRRDARRKAHEVQLEEPTSDRASSDDLKIGKDDVIASGVVAEGLRG